MGGPFIGPQGGKWANPEHTIPWHTMQPHERVAAMHESIGRGHTHAMVAHADAAQKAGMQGQHVPDRIHHVIAAIRDRTAYHKSQGLDGHKALEMAHADVSRAIHRGNLQKHGETHSEGVKHYVRSSQGVHTPVSISAGGVKRFGPDSKSVQEAHEHIMSAIDKTAAKTAAKPVQPTGPTTKQSPPPSQSSSKPLATKKITPHSTDAELKEAHDNLAHHMNAQLPKSQHVGSFQTAQGSVYESKNGLTTRTKTLHVGHDPNDVGLKPQSSRTVYAHPDDASRIGGHLSLQGGGTPRFAFQDGKIHLLSRNSKTGLLGSNGKPVEVSHEPKIGLSPIEVWHPDVHHKGKLAVHPGNPIVKLETKGTP